MFCVCCDDACHHTDCVSHDIPYVKTSAPDERRFLNIFNENALCKADKSGGYEMYYRYPAFFAGVHD